MSARRLWVVERKRSGGRWEIQSVVARRTRAQARWDAKLGERIERCFRATYGGKPDRYRVVAYVPRSPRAAIANASVCEPGARPK